MATVVCDIWINMDPQIITNGFRMAGIHPINKHTVPREKFDLLALRRWDLARSEMSSSSITTSTIPRTSSY